ncbi:MAG: phosphoglucosamine mutase [Candidatus Eremiobacteraeota bacterium]|nr:phosphoglucosamine mutase [Candidatus Eremiobacteraeota bacterium]
MSRLFGTDGVRGVANKDITCEKVLELGRSYGRILKESHARPRVIIGKDTRISSGMLELAFTAGLCSAGADVLLAGIMPTPAIPFLVRHLDASGGVMISASHNPIEDNGIKLFSHEGFKLPDTTEDRIETLSNEVVELPVSKEVGIYENLENADDLYISHIIDSAGEDLTGLRIGLDCANGAAYRIGGKIFKKLGAEVYTINTESDGHRINVECGSTNMAQLRDLVLEKKLDLGLAFDGDADRCLALDETGNVIDGDEILALFARDQMDRGIFKGESVVVTDMSNMGLERALEEMGLGMTRTKVGDRYVLEEMKKSGCHLGGEQSGHIICLTYSTTGDGCLTGVLLAGILKRSKKPMSQVRHLFHRVPQILLNIKTRRKNDYDKIPEIRHAINEIEEKLKGRGRILVRPSGTEPKLRIMLEGHDRQEINKLAYDLKDLMKKHLGGSLASC